MENSNLIETPVSSDFVNTVQKFLEQGKAESVLSLFKDKKYESVIECSSWDLIPIVTKYLTKQTEKDKLKEFVHCQKLVTIIAKRSNPEEALLQFIEEIEESSDDTVFINLLKPLQLVLERISPKKVNSFAWCFNAVQTYLQKLPPPSDLYLSGDEKLLLDCDTNFSRITSVYSEVLNFYEHFVSLVRINPEFQVDHKGVVCKFLIQLLGKPLVYLDMSNTIKVPGRGKILGDKIASLVNKLVLDPYVFLEYQDSNEDKELKKPSFFSLGVFYYIVLCSETYLENIPKVYDAVYIFQYTLKFVTELLHEGHHLCVEKALIFITRMLQSVTGLKLSYSLLDSSDHCYFCKALTNVIIYNEVKEVRLQAFNIFRTYLGSFELRGQYLLIYHLTDVINHSGLTGFLITVYKELLASEISSDEEGISIYLKDEKMWQVLSRFCYLDKKEESYLIELADQIISSLNLLRYLAIRDKNNVTGYKNFIPILKEKYLEPLKKGIMLSRAHYQLKLKELAAEQLAIDKKQDSGSSVSVTICDQELPELPFEEKKKVLQSSLVTFDVIDSLLCRVNECIDGA